MEREVDVEIVYKVYCIVYCIHNTDVNKYSKVKLNINTNLLGEAIEGYVGLKHGPICPRFLLRRKGDMSVSSRTRFKSSLHLKLDNTIERWAESRVWQSEWMEGRRKETGGKEK